MAFKHAFYFTISLALICRSVYGLDKEPKYSMFDFQEKLLEKLIRLEHSAGILRERFDVLSSNVNGELQSMKDENGQLKQETKKELVRITEQIEELRWEEWSNWGSCTANCSNGVGERSQARSRKKIASNGPSTLTQTETRPCSSVQFAGCINPQNGDQFFAVAYDYAFMLAQSTCTAMSPGGYVNAIRRTCSNGAPDCTAVCVGVGRTCFNSLHVYSGGHAQPTFRDTVKQKSLMMYKYNACGGGCGPNFCCCKM